MTADDAGAVGLAVLDRFLDAFTAADPGAVLDLFWPDALVWGTTMTELATASDPVAAYFAPLTGRAPGERAARWSGGASLVASEDVILISGAWTVAPGVAGGGASSSLRLSLAVSRRHGHWRIAQFHSSAMPH